MSSIFNDAIYLDDVPVSDWLTHYIGSGYRSCIYVTDHDKKGRIILFGYDKNGNPKTFVCAHKSHIKYVVKYDTDEKDIYGRYVATKYFENTSSRSKYLDAVGDGLIIVEALRPEQEFLQKVFGSEVFSDNFNIQPQRIHSIDIETEISDTFMSPAVADNRVNMITVHDSLTDKFYTWSLSHAEIDFKEEPLSSMPKDKFVFYEFYNDENAMLEHFINWYHDNMPDVIYGWNIRGYDIPYLYVRLTKQLGKTYANMFSPVGKCFIKEVNHDNARNDVAAEIEIKIDGVFQADGLLLYRDKFKIAGSTLDGGFSLDNVGETEGLGHKIHYTGTLKDLYIKDYQKFYEYNVRDVDLCKKIDDKRKMIALARKIAGLGLCNYDTIYSSISYLIGSCIVFAKHKMNAGVFTSYLKEKLDFGDGFEGAFVFPCEPNVYRGGIGCIDFASLYPSNIRSINASPETYVGKLLIYLKTNTGNITVNISREKRFDPDSKVPYPNDNPDKADWINANDPRIDHFELKLPGIKDKRQKITLQQLKLLLDTKCIFTANNTLFLKHEVKWGVIAKWCEFFYAQRKINKKKEMQIFHMLHNEEEVAKLSESEIIDIKIKMENYHAIQMAFKIMINSIYGCCGTAFSPIADPNIAQSITRQGQMCNKAASGFVKKYLIEKYGAPEDYKVAVGGDTDSQFLNLQCITDWMKKEYKLSNRIMDWPQKYKNELWKSFSSFVDKDVNNFVRTMVHEYCHTNEQNVLSYELEYLGDVGVYERKKHYAVHKIFDEGDPVDKIKYSGIEMKKSTLPKHVKTFLQDIYEGVILKDWKDSDYQNYISELYTKFKTFDVDNISFWKGYNTERSATGFLQMAQMVNPQTGKTIGTTGIAKAATYYNQIINKLGLGKKYDELRLGDKCRLLYIEPSNQYRIDVIAYKDGQYPDEFRTLFKPDYRKMFEKTVLDALKSFREACKFKTIDPSKQIACDIFDF